jgi:hypothetical protein
MKKILITILFFLLFLNGFPQTYRNSFDVIEIQSYEGRGASFRTNASRTIHAIGSKFLLSYINMYETTKDKKYLDKFIIQVKRIHDVRDDEITNTYNTNPLLTGLSETVASSVDSSLLGSKRGRAGNYNYTTHVGLLGLQSYRAGANYFNSKEYHLIFGGINLEFIYKFQNKKS